MKPVEKERPCLIKRKHPPYPEGDEPVIIRKGKENSVFLGERRHSVLIGREGAGGARGKGKVPKEKKEKPPRLDGTIQNALKKNFAPRRKRKGGNDFNLEEKAGKQMGKKKKDKRDYKQRLLGKNSEGAIDRKQPPVRGKRVAHCLTGGDYSGFQRDLGYSRKEHLHVYILQERLGGGAQSKKAPRGISKNFGRNGKNGLVAVMFEDGGRKPFRGRVTSTRERRNIGGRIESPYTRDNRNVFMRSFVFI